jgi:hypothetical protein
VHEPGNGFAERRRRVVFRRRIVHLLGWSMGRHRVTHFLPFGGKNAIITLLQPAFQL